MARALLDTAAVAFVVDGKEHPWLFCGVVAFVPMGEQLVAPPQLVFFRATTAHHRSACLTIKKRVKKVGKHKSEMDKNSDKTPHVWITNGFHLIQFHAVSALI